MKQEVKVNFKDEAINQIEEEIKQQDERVEQSKKEDTNTK